MKTIRRSRADLRLGHYLRFGQRWRRRHDGLIATVAQIHRADCLAELAAGERRMTISFADLRGGWDQLVAHDQEVR